MRFVRHQKKVLRSKWLRLGVVAVALLSVFGVSVFALMVASGQRPQDSGVIDDRVAFSYDVPDGWATASTEANRLIFASASIAEQYARSFLEEHPNTGYVKVGAYAIGDRTAAGEIELNKSIEPFVSGLYGDSVVSVERTGGPARVGFLVLLRLAAGPTEAAQGEIEVREFWAWVEDDLVVIGERWGPESSGVEVARVQEAFDTVVQSLRVRP